MLEKILDPAKRRVKSWIWESDIYRVLYEHSNFIQIHMISNHRFFLAPYEALMTIRCR